MPQNKNETSVKFSSGDLMFVIALLIYGALSGYHLLWPLWDNNEAKFVSNLLTTMQPAGPVDVFYGDLDTVFVSGPVEVADWPRGYASEQTFEDCLAVREHGHLTIAASPQIYGWKIDPSFLHNSFLPFVPACNEDEDCRKTTCLESGTYTVLGNRKKTPDGQNLVEIPDPTLVDYPLFRPGAFTPETFSAEYTKRMGERTTVQPVFLAFVMLFFGIMLHGSLKRGFIEHLKEKSLKAMKEEAEKYKDENDIFHYEDENPPLSLNPVLLVSSFNETLTGLSPSERNALLGLILVAFAPVLGYWVFHDQTAFTLLMMIDLAATCLSLYGFSVMRWEKPKKKETGFSSPE